MAHATSERYIDKLAHQLFSPILRSKIVRRNWKVLGWDAEQGLSLNIAKGDNVILIEFEARDDLRGCFGRTRLFNVFARHSFDSAIPLRRKREFL